MYQIMSPQKQFPTTGGANCLEGLSGDMDEFGEGDVRAPTLIVVWATVAASEAVEFSDVTPHALIYGGPGVATGVASRETTDVLRSHSRAANLSHLSIHTWHSSTHALTSHRTISTRTPTASCARHEWATTACVNMPGFPRPTTAAPHRRRQSRGTSVKRSSPMGPALKSFSRLRHHSWRALMPPCHASTAHRICTAPSGLSLSR